MIYEWRSGSSLGATKLFRPNLCVGRSFPGGTKKRVKLLFYCYGLSARTGNLSNACLEHYRLTNLPVTRELIFCKVASILQL